MPIVGLEPGSRKRSMVFNNLWIRMCLWSKRTTTFFPLKSTTWLLNSKLMKSPCVPAGIISKCTTVDCEDYTIISGGRDGVHEFRHQRWIKEDALVPSKDILHLSME